MNLVYLLIGGNLGNRQENLALTIDLVTNRCGSLLKQSSVYETAAWGKTDQPDFLNQVLLVDTPYAPEPLLRHILAVEQDLGRFRGEKYGPRTMDIDILLFNNEIITVPGLTIPHSRMASRRFVLAPLAEIAGKLIHPITGKTIDQMLLECADHLPVDKKI